MLRSLFFLISAFAALTTFASASGEEGSKGTPITLEQALDIAFSNNPRLKSAGYQVEAAAAGVVKAGSGNLPKIEITEIYQRTTNPMWAFGHKLNQEAIASADFSPDKLNNPDPTDNWGTILSITQPIYTGGKVAAYKEQATLAKEASLKDRERIMQKTVFEVTRAYYGIDVAESNLEVVRDALRAADANMQTARSLRDAGVIVESDFLAARVGWAELKEDEIKSLNAVALSKAVLNNVMGVDLEADYSLSERLPDDLEKMGAEIGLVPEGGKHAGAAVERPDLAGMKLREEIGEKGIKAARADLLPTIGLTANYEIDGSSLVTGDGTNWTVMGVLKWNLFSGYEDTARVSEARAESNRIKEMKREMESGIRLEALSARFELKAARERVYVAKESVRQTEESFRIVNNRYAEGMATIVDLFETGSAQKKAKMSLSQAVYDYKVGEARLKLALGILK